MTKTTQLFSALLLVSAVAVAQTPSERAQIVSHYNMDKLNALKTEFSAAEAENKRKTQHLAATAAGKAKRIRTPVHLPLLAGFGLKTYDRFFFRLGAELS